jgi:flagellar biosynthesis protein FlhF
MTVKKFEARSMKEALEMIKTQLGPDAIILSAKEITKGFGLGGEKSIEVTAAFSETTLHKKKFVESKLPQQQKEQFQRIAAKEQKEVMRKVIEGQIAKMNSQAPKSNIPYKMTEKRYADIDNDQVTSATTEQHNQSQAFSAVAKKAWNDMEVTSLKKEIETLKQVMSQFQSVPQSFVQAHPGADFGVHYMLSGQFQKLTAAGLLPEIAGEILTACQKNLSTQQQQNRATVDSFIAKHILDSVKVTHDCHEQFHLFVGPSGSGKTTSLIKLASEMILNQRKRVAIISTDNSKVGAAEQMKIFAQILNVPFLSIRSQQDWSHVIPHIDQLDHVLIDYSGLNLRNQEEVNFMKRMSPPVYKSIRTHLVLSSLAKDTDLLECARRYQAFGYNDVIFTGLDEASQHGNIYNFVRKTKAEIFGFGIGSKVPEDFEFATPERVVDLLMKITQTRKQEATI